MSDKPNPAIARLNLVRVGKFEMIDHGLEYSQYFLGEGAAFTQYNFTVTGVGCDIEDAIEDCLDQIGECDFYTHDLVYRIQEHEGWDTFPATPKAGSDPDERYRVSIRWNEHADSDDQGEET